jgi:hypothetical protein
MAAAGAAQLLWILFQSFSSIRPAPGAGAACREHERGVKRGAVIVKGLIFMICRIKIVYLTETLRRPRKHVLCVRVARVLCAHRLRGNSDSGERNEEINQRAAGEYEYRRPAKRSRPTRPRAASDDQISAAVQSSPARPAQQHSQPGVADIATATADNDISPL